MSIESHPDDWLVGDIQSRFWNPSASQEDEQGVDVRLARAISQSAFVRSVELAWWVVDDGGVRIFDGGAVVEDLDAPARVLRSAGALAAPLLDSRLGPGADDRQRRDSFEHRVWQEDGAVHVHIWRTTPIDEAELLLRLREPVNVDDEPWPERLDEFQTQFQRPRSQLRDLISAVLPLRRLETTTTHLDRLRTLEERERQVRDLVLYERDGLEEKLRRARNLLHALGDLLQAPALGSQELQRLLAMVERVVRVVVHRVLGTNRDGVARRPVRDQQVLWDGLVYQIAQRIEYIATLRARVHPRVRRADGTLAVDDRIRLLSMVLDAVCEPPQALPDELLAEQGAPDGASPELLRAWELRLFVLWALVHEQIRAARRRLGREDPEGTAEETSWAQAVGATRRWLPSILAQWTAVPDDPERARDPFDATLVRNWFRLWFALELLAGEPELEGGIVTERRRYRADLAFVFRECLRFKLYGGRPGFVVRPDAFSAALQGLVDHHVRRRVNLPREQDVRSHLAMVGDARHPRGYLFAAGHLQHVLELYIVGHFLCEVRMENVDDHADVVRGSVPGTMGDLLAGRAGVAASVRAQDELRAAFSLAALFHDVGMTLFPDFHRPRDPLAADDPSLSAGLDQVEGAMSGAGRELVLRASRELENHGIWDAVEEPGLAEWVAEQEEHGRPDHALVGAWYLLRAARRVEGLSSEVVRAAVRAVMLHGAVPQAIDPERDPVAALLVLCDELFDWEPGGRAGPDPAALGRSLHSLAVDMSPRRSRASHLRFHHTRVFTEPDGEGSRLVAAIDVGASAGGWPHIELELVAPEFLGAHVFPVWLGMAQNLGRIRPGVMGWGPRITVVGAVPEDVRRTVQTSRSLLERLCERMRAPYRGRLVRWLEERPEPLLPLPDADKEMLVIVPLGRSVGRRDLRPELPELVRAAERLMLELDGRRR